MTNQPQVFGPYSSIRQTGNLYIISGQVGVNTETKSTPSSVEAQTAQIMQNLAVILAGVNLTLNAIIKTTVYLTDMDNFIAMNDEYTKHFKVPFPARTTVGVKELPRLGGIVPLLIEVEAIAVKSES